MSRLLIIDDEVDICEFTREYFQAHGYDVRCALSGSDAFLVLSYFTPNVVLLDIKLPDMSGRLILKYLRRRHPDTKIIIITGLLKACDTEQANTFGADLILSKPLSISELREAVAS